MGGNIKDMGQVTKVRLSCYLVLLSIWVNIGLGNGLLPDGTKPLPEPMLARLLAKPGNKTAAPSLPDPNVPMVWVWNLQILRLQLHLPGARCSEIKSTSYFLWDGSYTLWVFVDHICTQTAQCPQSQQLQCTIHGRRESLQDSVFKIQCRMVL